MSNIDGKSWIVKPGGEYVSVDDLPPRKSRIVNRIKYTNLLLSNDNELSDDFSGTDKHFNINKSLNMSVGKEYRLRVVCSDDCVFTLTNELETVLFKVNLATNKTIEYVSEPFILKTDNLVLNRMYDRPSRKNPTTLMIGID